MRWTACALLTIALALVPATYDALAAATDPRAAFAWGTALMVVLVAPLPVLWPLRTASGGGLRWPLTASVAVAVLLARAAATLTPVIFAAPIDPTRGDMSSSSSTWCTEYGCPPRRNLSIAWLAAVPP